MSLLFFGITTEDIAVIPNSPSGTISNLLGNIIFSYAVLASADSPIVMIESGKLM